MPGFLVVTSLAIHSAISVAVIVLGRGRRRLPDPTERGAVVLLRVRVDVDPGGEEPFRPLVERDHGRRRRLGRERLQQARGVASVGDFPGYQVAAGLGLLQRPERAAVDERVRAAAEPVPDDEAALAGLRDPGGDRRASHDQGAPRGRG